MRQRHYQLHLKLIMYWNYSYRCHAKMSDMRNCHSNFILNNFNGIMHWLFVAKWGRWWHVILDSFLLHFSANIMWPCHISLEKFMQMSLSTSGNYKQKIYRCCVWVMLRNGIGVLWCPDWYNTWLPFCNHVLHDHCVQVENMYEQEKFFGFPAACNWLRYFSSPPAAWRLDR